MALNLSAGGDGDFTPYLKYNAKAGRFYVRPQGATQDVEVERPRLVIDMPNIKTGWIYYAEGGGAPPEKVWDPSLSQMAPRPAGPKKFKRGFEALVVGADPIQGVGKLGLREFGSTAGVVISAILKMYDAYEAGAKDNAGKLPFYRCSGVVPVEGKYGTNYEPNFQLIGWVERVKVPEFDSHGSGEDSFGSPPPTGGYDERNPPPQTRNDLDDEIPF